MGFLNLKKWLGGDDRVEVDQKIERRRRQSSDLDSRVAELFDREETSKAKFVKAEADFNRLAGEVFGGDGRDG